MRRMLLLLLIGGALGYLAGYKDGRRHLRPVYERMIDQAGGSARGKYDGDVDRATAGTLEH